MASDSAVVNRLRQSSTGPLAAVVSEFKSAHPGLGWERVYRQAEWQGLGVMKFGSNDFVLVTNDSVQSDDQYDIIQANLDAVNYLYDRRVEPEHISRSALLSYYVDYYFSQVNNGGHSQFIWNSGWEEVAISCLHQGLTEMDASKQLQIFEECARYVSSLGKQGLENYLAKPYAAILELRDLDSRTYKISDAESLLAINCNWLKRHPKLLAVSSERRAQELALRVQQHQV